MAKKFTALVFVTCLAILGTASTAMAAKAQFVMKIANAASDSTAAGLALTDYFKPYIEEHSGGRIQVDVYNNGVLGQDRQVYEAMQIQTIEANLAATAALANFDKSFNILDVPFLFKDYPTAHAALDGEFGALVARDLPKSGIRMLAFCDNAFRNISNTKRPVVTMEDMKGLKIRVMEAPTYINSMKALGANPTPMAFNEVYTGLQQGTIDGQDNGIVLTYTMKFHEVLKYYSFTEHCFSANIITISEAFWQSLPEDLQKVVQDGALYAAKHQRVMNAEMEKEFLKIMEDSGVQVNYLSPEEHERWKKATAHIIDEMKGVVRDDVLAAAREIDAKYGQ